MRIIAGSRRGMKLTMHQGLKTRPTADRVREALFSTLQTRIPGARILDLFAGSGAVGLEALSRGGAYCVFVEKDRQALFSLQANIDKTDFAPQSRVLSMDFRRALALLSEESVFDICYLDPPYEKKYYEDALTLLSEYDIISKNGIIVCESRKGNSLGAISDDFIRIKSKLYGESQLSYYTKQS